MDPLVQRIERLDGGRILDAATSFGDFLRLLTKSFKSYDEAVGVDKAADRIETARNHADDDLKYEVMDAAKLSFDDDSFDTVAIRHSLHHMRDINPVLTDCVRVLKPGGLFILGEVIQVPDQIQDNSFCHFHHWLAAADRAFGEDHFDTITREEVLAHIEKLGLKETDVFEHLEDPDPEEVKEIVGHICERGEGHIKKLEEIGGYDELTARGRAIMENMKQNGYVNEPTLYVLGRKAAQPL